MQEEESEELKSGKNSWYLWIAGMGTAFLIWFAFAGKWGELTFDNATFVSWMIVMGLFVFSQVYIMYKHKTAKMIYDGNPSHTTFMVDDLIKLGGWGIARKGGVKALGIYFPGGEGTLVAPYNSFNVIGKNLVCTTRVKKVDLPELPKGVRNYIIENRLPLPVEYGIFSSIQLRNPDNAKIQEEILHQNTLINLYEEWMKKILNVKEDVLESARRQSETISGRKSPGEILKKLILESEEDKK